MTEEKTAKVVENTEKNGSVCLKSRGELARELFREGYNCSQAVTLAFADELETRGISREMAAGLASSFGGGLGRLREVCGCVSGMALVCGALEGYTDPKAAAEKQDHYKRIQKLVTTFKDENGSYICRELLSGSCWPGLIRIRIRCRRRERRATIKSAHVQSSQPVQRIFWRDI